MPRTYHESIKIEIRMKKRHLKFIGLLLISLFFLQGTAQAQRSATVRIDKSITHQQITGFGGFVNSPQFGYNHMSAAEIRKMWGEDSETGYNIMRLYIPTGESSWNQSIVTTAKLAKELGLIVFASPWSMPASMKTINTVNGQSGGEANYLKEESYAEYAEYLNKFVVFLRNNGVELDAISIQNEPNYRTDYAGCIWTTAQMTKFLKENRHLISCPVMAPETIGMTDDFANALLANDVINHFDIYGGHQYNSLGTAHKNFHAKGKQVWMTEYLINWNSGQSSDRNFDWSRDVFDFADKINLCMLQNVNAWVHYATKRWYGMLGDGEMGTTNSVVTKRGYVLSHYAKFTTGTTRIENSWTDSYSQLSGSSYLSVTGDSVVIMVMNPSSSSYSLNVDLPFNTLSGKRITTTQTTNMVETALTYDAETARPVVELSASSVNTLVFVKSSEKSGSDNMVGEEVHYFRLEDQTVTNAAFGTSHQLSGKTSVTFRDNSPLISANTSLNNGYLQLSNRYSSLVFETAQISSAGSMVIGKPTLYYVNNEGAMASYNYGVNYPGGENMPISSGSPFTFDLSKNRLPNGCTGLIRLTCSNVGSVLTISFKDVFLRMGNERMYKFTGGYSGTSGYLIDCLENPLYTSLDFTETTDVPTTMDLYASAANKNCIYLIDGNVANNNTNVISGTTCSVLRLADGGDFYAPFNFQANSASYTRSLDGYDIMVLPFNATIPAGLKAYTLAPSASEVVCTQIAGSTIPANTPVLISGSGDFTFEGDNGAGSFSVETPLNQKTDGMVGVYISVQAQADDYVLKTDGGETAFHKVAQGSEPAVKPFSAYLETTLASAATLPLNIKASGIDKTSAGNSLKARTQNGELFIKGLTIGKPWKVYNISSSLVYSGVASGSEENVSLPAKGVYIVVSEGSAIKVVY